MFRAIFLALAIGFATPAFAQESNENDPAVMVDQMVRSIGRQSQPYNDILTEANDLLLAIMDRFDEASALAEDGASAKEAEKWADSWLPDARRKTAALRARLNRLKPIDLGDFNRYLEPNDPAMVRLKDGAKTFPQATSGLVGMLEDTLKSVAPYAEKAAAGDAKAQVRLGVAILSAFRAGLEMENATIRQSLLTSDESHPQFWFYSAVLAGNKGVAEVLAVTVDEAAGEPGDLKASADRIRAFANDIRAAARRIDPAARAVMATLYNDPSLVGSPFQLRADQAFSLYAESAKIEVSIADLLTNAADQFGKDGVDSDKVLDAMGQLEGLVDQRAALAERRRTLLLQ